LSNFPVLRKNIPKAGNLGEVGQKIDPLVIKRLYNINVTASGKTSSRQAVAEFEQDYFYPSDFGIFEKKYGLPDQAIEKLIGPNDPINGYLGEAILDIEYIMGVGTLTPTWVFSSSAMGLDLIDWALNVTSFPNGPKVHSISWGSGESGFDPSTVNRTNIEFMKLATLGYSVLAASGDDGTGHTNVLWCGTFDPTFPASSPYLTSVGGTYLDQSSNKEKGVYFSGGGFSTIFQRPSYQDAAVKHFFAQGNLPDPSYYAANGRGFPDVSALSTNFQIVVQGFWSQLSGTSASTPTFAAMIALINDARELAGKKPLGFLNPLLYKLQYGVGTDITEGSNDSGECPKGFSATNGWDAITGLGTPQFPLLLKQLLNV